MTPRAPAPVLAIEIPSPPERHDELIRMRIAPVIRRLRAGTSNARTWFERANKPDWSVRVLAAADEPWLETVARPALAGIAEARFIEEPPDDKWTGGPHAARELAGFHGPDTLAAVDALEVDADGRLGSRAQYSVLVVEGLLDALGLHGDARQRFYRESFEWAVTLGRWDREVLDSLERTFARQGEALAASLTGGDAAAPGRWPSPSAARIGAGLLAALSAWAGGVAGDSGRLALHAAHGHSNRLGIHGGREAALRYLVWRARGGRPLEPA